MNLPNNVHVEVHRMGNGVGVDVEVNGPSAQISTTEQLWAFFDELCKEAEKRPGWMPKKEKKEDK